MTSLRQALVEYLAVRRAMGTALREPGQTLGQFLDFLEREGAEVITTQMAIRWAMLPTGAQRATWARRLTMVRRFASWWSPFDSRTEIPPKGALPEHRRRNPPYIFSDHEVEQLMKEAAHLHPESGIRSRSYQTLLGLLASTGLRPGEAMALDVEDVDLINGILTIRESKFGKSRFVPVSESTRQALLNYTWERCQRCCCIRTEAFLVSGRGLRIPGSQARRTFAHLTRAVGLRPPGQGKRVGRGPRLQDFRHTFATKTLIAWYRAGLDVARELPKLSTYLGHVEICHTYWYLQAVPELLQVAALRLERKDGTEALQ